MANGHTNLSSMEIDSAGPDNGSIDTSAKAKTSTAILSPDEPRSEAPKTLESPNRAPVASSDLQTGRAAVEPDVDEFQLNSSSSLLTDILPDGRQLLTLKLDVLKAELGKRNLRKTGSTSVLLERLRAAINDEDQSASLTRTSGSELEVNSTKNCACCESLMDSKIHDLRHHLQSEIGKLRYELHGDNAPHLTSPPPSSGRHNEQE